MKKTPIETINHHLAEFAQTLDIFCAEHLVCALSPEQLITLLDYLGIDDLDGKIKAKLSQISTAFCAVPNAQYFGAGKLCFGLSANTDHFVAHTFKPLPYAALNLPAKVDLIELANASPIKDQGALGTCVSQSTTKVLEMMVGKGVRHSAAFNYYFAKQLDANTDDGTCLQSALEAARLYGSCEERLAPYHELLLSYSDNTYQPNPIAIKLAKQHRISDWVVCKPNKDVINQLKLLLSGGLSGKPRAVIVGVKVFKDQLNNNFSNRTGEWAKPSPFSDTSEYYLHALTLIGLHDDLACQSGGWALLAQSYGKDYAKDGDYGAGIVRFSYQYLLDNLVAFGSYLLPGEREQFIADEATEFQAQAALAKPELVSPPIEFHYQTMANNHIGIFGPSGSGKTTRVCEIIEQAVMLYPKLSWRIIDPHREMEKRLSHLNPTVINAESNGLPFELIKNLRGSAADIKVRSLSNDLQSASLSMGIHQIEELNKLLEIAIASGIKNNLDLKQFLEDNLEPKLRNHIGEFLMLLRSSTVIDQNKPGVFIHELSAFDELPVCRALYAISLLRYSKNIQFEDASQPVVLVFDEAELLLEGRSNHALKRFIQESRKLNMAGIFVAQQKPTDKWLTNNLNQIVELEGAPVLHSARAKVDMNAIKQARFTDPKPPANSLLMKFAVISQMIR